jgi:hypothetical protein
MSPARLCTGLLKRGPPKTCAGRGARPGCAACARRVSTTAFGSPRWHVLCPRALMVIPTLAETTQSCRATRVRRGRVLNCALQRARARRRGFAVRTSHRGVRAVRGRGAPARGRGAPAEAPYMAVGRQRRRQSRRRRRRRRLWRRRRGHRRHGRGGGFGGRFRRASRALRRATRHRRASARPGARVAGAVMAARAVGRVHGLS